MNEGDFKVEAELGVLDQIHRTLTFANTREAAHGALEKYNKIKFNSAVKGYQKTQKKMRSLTPGTKAYDIQHAKSLNHLSNAQLHSDAIEHHNKKAFAASEEGYEDHHKQLKSQFNDMIANHNQKLQAQKARRGNNIPKSPADNTVKPPRPLVPQKNSSVITPHKVPNIKPIRDTTKDYAKVKTNLNKPIKQPRSPAKVKNAAALNIKAQPAIKPIKPPKIPTVKPIKSITPPKIRATPSKRKTG